KRLRAAPPVAFSKETQQTTPPNQRSVLAKSLAIGKFSQIMQHSIQSRWMALFFSKLSPAETMERIGDIQDAARIATEQGTPIRNIDGATTELWVQTIESILSDRNLIHQFN
ncbi:MAG: hypothetical protein AAFP90_17220, partial [Planctomycetota bacterium]